MNIGRVHHIGMIVADLDRAIGGFRDVLGLELDHTEPYGEELEIAFLPCGEALVELIRPLTAEGFSADWLASAGPGIQHVAFEVDDLEAALQTARGQGRASHRCRAPARRREHDHRLPRTRAVRRHHRRARPAAVSVLRTDEPAEGVLRLRLDRPAKRNAVDRELAEALVEAFGSSDAKVVILGSSGPEAFCAGLDLSLEPAERVAVSDLLYETYERMLASPAPIVASIPGPAIGGGAQLAIASDLRVAGPTAQIRFAGPGHGLAVGAWGLGSLVGRGRAMDLCLSMRPVSADEAAAMGLVDRVAHDPDAEALELATRLARLDAPGRRPRETARHLGRPARSPAARTAGQRSRRGRERSRRPRSPLPSRDDA